MTFPPDQHRSDPNAPQQDGLPFWLIVVVIFALWTIACFLDGQRVFPRNMYVIGLIFVVPSMSCFFYLVLRTSKTLSKALGVIVVFFWPLTLALVVWVLRTIVRH